jgi:hypothetical protein
LYARCCSRHRSSSLLSCQEHAAHSVFTTRRLALQPTTSTCSRTLGSSYQV